MKNLLTVLLFMALSYTLSAQNSSWAPFYHGVASGNPQANSVVLWSRITPDNSTIGTYEVDWVIATDIELEDVVQSGSVSTGAAIDYTIHVLAEGLASNTTYYYGFQYEGTHSLTGRTRTAPNENEAVEQLKFGLASCANYQAGHFNAYHKMSERNDLNAVIHLGDYIYELGQGQYGDPIFFEEKPLEPAHELLTLDDYRIRYSIYHLDSNLIRLRQQHPIIAVWDDHEFANDAYKDGAQNHNEGEGDWEVRKAVAKQAYFEWMPFDNGSNAVYRTMSYGNLADLILLDTRIEGRDQQVEDIRDTSTFSMERTMLGEEQKAWFLEQLKTSEAKWKIVGQQVFFSELNVGWGALIDENLDYWQAESVFVDIWDGYVNERTQIIDKIKEDNIDNIVILTGDFHTAFANEVADHPTSVSFSELPFVGQAPIYTVDSSYNAVTGEGAIGVEFVVPSITSANFDENFPIEQAVQLQNFINSPIELVPGVINLGNPNPHIKFADLTQHGYVVLDVTPTQVQADYYFIDVANNDAEEQRGASWLTKDSTSYHLETTTMASAEGAFATPAPSNPPNLVNNVENISTLTMLGVYPNPASDYTTLHYTLKQNTPLSVNLYDATGKFLRTILEEQAAAGIYVRSINISDLPSGQYYYQIKANNQVTNQIFIVR